MVVAQISIDPLIKRFSEIAPLPPAAPPNAAKITVSGGNVLLTFAGIPGYSYQVQRSGDLLTWTTVATVAAQSSGLVTYTDQNPPSPSNYRAIPAP